MPGLRPTSERIRETLFNWLAPHIAGARCLDLFAATGALGLEALSRGAASATFVESSKSAVATLRRNVKALEAENATVLEADAFDYLQKPFDLPDLMKRPGVAQAVSDMGVRYIIWLDGDTERVAEGGSLSCAAGPGGGGCFGFAWWQNDADYNAAVWDLKGLQSAGSVTADVSGTSFLPALVIPIPLIARARAAACKGLADQLRTFIVDEPQA